MRPARQAQPSPDSVQVTCSSLRPLSCSSLDDRASGIIVGRSAAVQASATRAARHAELRDVPVYLEDRLSDFESGAEFRLWAEPDERGDVVSQINSLPPRLQRTLCEPCDRVMLLVN